MRISFKTIVLLGSFLICIMQTSCKQAAAQTVIDGKFKEYKLILQEVNPMSPNSDESFKAFQSKVKSALNEGWSLVGGASDLGGYISQTVAKQLKTYLVSKGISADRITTEGFGETMPIADSNTAAGRAKNTRVEIKLSY